MQRPDSVSKHGEYELLRRCRLARALQFDTEMSIRLKTLSMVLCCLTAGSGCYNTKYMVPRIADPHVNDEVSSKLVGCLLHKSDEAIDNCLRAIPNVTVSDGKCLADDHDISLCVDVSRSTRLGHALVSGAVVLGLAGMVIGVLVGAIKIEDPHKWCPSAPENSC